jgi:prefoldin alpha subunit
MTANTKLQKTIEKYNVKKAQIESLAREMETLANSRASLDVSKEALETLDGAKKGKEMLVPLGVNTFLKAIIEDPSKVVKGIGAGLFKDADIKEAMKDTEKAIENFENIKTKIEADFKKTAAEMETLEPELEKMMADKRAKD